jgi:rubrerythrin
MFDVHIFVSTFFLVLVAELGDKTQIATFSLSATSGKPVKIFLASASALVLSTIIAAIAGRVTSHFVPDFTSYIAAGLFIAFGVIMIAGRESILIEDCYARLLAMEEAGTRAAKERMAKEYAQGAEGMEVIIHEEENHIGLLRYLIREKRFFEDDINREPELRKIYDRVSGYSLSFSELSRDEIFDKLIEMEEIGLAFYRFLYEHLKGEEHQENELQQDLADIITEEESHIRFYSQLRGSKG